MTGSAIGAAHPNFLYATTSQTKRAALKSPRVDESINPHIGRKIDNSKIIDGIL